MGMEKRLLELKNELLDKRLALETNCHSLKMFGPKDMPLAIYDYVIENLEAITFENEIEQQKEIKHDSWKVSS